MEKEFLILLNNEGERTEAYRNNVHYFVKEDKDKDIQDILNNFSYQEILGRGGKWFNKDDGEKLVSGEFIYQNQEIIKKPIKIIGEEEIKQQQLIELEQEYNTQKENFKSDLLIATLTNNTSAIASLQEEFKDFQLAYEEAKQEIIRGDV